MLISIQQDKDFLIGKLNIKHYHENKFKNSFIKKKITNVIKKKKT